MCDFRPEGLDEIGGGGGELYAEVYRLLCRSLVMSCTVCRRPTHYNSVRNTSKIKIYPEPGPSLENLYLSVLFYCDSFDLRMWFDIEHYGTEPDFGEPQLWCDTGGDIGYPDRCGCGEYREYDGHPQSGGE